MNDLVFKGNERQALTSSLLVADKFGKEHKHVLTAVRELVKGPARFSAHPMFVESTDAKVRWFCQSSYYDTKGEERKMYIMTRVNHS